MAEDDGSLVAAAALYIHEVRVYALYQSFQFVLLLLLFVSGVQDISVHCCGGGYKYLYFIKTKISN